jgi:hypothetical protein
MAVSVGWRAYEDALLEVLGVADARPPAGGRLFRVLFQPTFEDKSCATFCDDGHEGIFEFRILQEPTDDLFSATLSGNLIPPPTPRQCWSAMADVPPFEVQSLHQFFDGAELATLSDFADKNCRDGISFRFIYRGPDGTYDVVASNPMQETAPRHLRLARLFVDMLQQHFAGEPMPAAHNYHWDTNRSYLDALSRYI